MRGRRAFVVLTVYLLLLAGFTWMVDALQERNLQVQAGFGAATFASPQIGQSIFTALLILETLLVLFLAPAFTAGAISLEREKQTLDLLAVTPISSLAIVLGKLFSALTYVFLLIVASIPLTAIVFTFGGVGPDDVVRAYIVLLVTALGLGSVGLFFSALMRRTQSATIVTYFTVLAMTLGATFIWIFWTAMTSFNVARGPFDGDPAAGGVNRNPPEAILWFNPFVADADVICGTETGFGTFCGIISGVTGRPLFGGPGVVVPQPAPAFDGGAARADILVAGPEPQPLGLNRDTYWPRASAAWIVLSAFLILLSVQLVSPTRRWRLRRLRGRRPRLPRLPRRSSGTEIR
jgi:ABC-type transport system involved in multi-copper enzyme maturation permease subunit